MKLRRILSMCLCLLLVLSVFTPAASAETAAEGRIVVDANTYTVTKVSNPEAGEREADGLISGGDRENSYTWRLAARGDEIYIATTRNIGSALVNMYAGQFAEAGLSQDQLWAMIDLATNGDIPRNDANEGANIISYNRVTGEFKVIYTADTGDYFRMAVTYGENVYFGSYSAVPTNPQYILKLDTEGRFTKVFQTMGSVSLRANCEYDGHLFFAGADDRTPVAEGDGQPTKMAVLRKSNEDDTVWDRVADYRDFGVIPYDPIMASWAGAPIWELASHNGWIYATAPSMAGFVIFRGRPAEAGEAANEYGWHWEEVAGLNNGINNPGLSDVEGGEPGTMRSLIGSVYEWNGTLYAYNFDHSFGGEAAAFAGMLQQLSGADVKASEYLYYMYNSLQNPQKIWALNDETGKFEENEAFTEMTEGTLSEYIWRMGTYDGDLYISTMDPGVFYNYLTQLTNGSFFTCSLEEVQERIGYLWALIDLLSAAEENTGVDLSAAEDALNQLRELLEQLSTMEINQENLEQIQENLTEVEEILRELSATLLAMASGATLDELSEWFLSEDVMDLLIDQGLTISAVLFQGLDVSELIPEELDNEYTQRLVEILRLVQQAGNTYTQLGPILQAAYREMVKVVLAQYFAELMANWIAQIREILSSIDVEGIQMYLYINGMVMRNEWGFDLFRTSDGESFEVITRSGFDDKYNYGCSAFLETEEGLYIGTCNPFYGGQLYLLTNSDPDCPCAQFVDMPAYGTPEHEAIDWAFTEGITAGMDETHFGTGKTLTRAQTATFLYAAAGRPDFDETTAENNFSDVPAGKWYTKAVLWAASEGLVAGYSDGTFKPGTDLTRGQILVILYAWADRPDVSEVENPYSDVPAGKWFTNAALWAYDEGIEWGEDGLFGQATPCTREAFVLYLYRCMTGNCLLGQ